MINYENWRRLRQIFNMQRGNNFVHCCIKKSLWLWLIKGKSFQDNSKLSPWASIFADRLSIPNGTSAFLSSHLAHDFFNIKSSNRLSGFNSPFGFGWWKSKFVQYKMPLWLNSYTLLIKIWRLVHFIFFCNEASNGIFLNSFQDLSRFGLRIIAFLKLVGFRWVLLFQLRKLKDYF